VSPLEAARALAEAVRAVRIHYGDMPITGLEAHMFRKLEAFDKAEDDAREAARPPVGFRRTGQ
jgi:hypothetical protein